MKGYNVQSTTDTAGHNPLSLGSPHNTTRAWNDLNTVIILFQPVMEEISTNCDQSPAKRLQAVKQMVEYLH